MKHINTILVVCSFILAGMLQACNTKDNGWTFVGTTDFSGTVYLYQIDHDLQSNLIDSTEIEKDKFSFKGANLNDRLTPYKVVFNQPKNIGIEFLIKDGEKLKASIKNKFNVSYSGTPIAKTYNKFVEFHGEEMKNLMEFKQKVSDNSLSPEEVSAEMLRYQEKAQDQENEKISFLKTILNPELNSYLVLHEAIISGTVEKEVFGKYMNALTPEGSMTNNGHKVHQIYEDFEAYALSREMEILDTATIRKRYNKLNEESKSSDFAKKVEQHLLHYKSE